MKSSRLTKDQQALMYEIDLYVDNMQLPHIKKSMVVTLTKSKFEMFKAIKNKAEAAPGLLAHFVGNKYKGFEVRSV